MSEKIDLREAEKVKLEELSPHPRNYRVHTPEQREQIASSLRAHGFYRPLLVSSDGFILAGHGVAETAAELGISEVMAIRLPYEHEDPQAIRVLVGDNYIAGLAEDDRGMLVEILADLKEQEDGLEGTGFSLDSIDEWQNANDEDEESKGFVPPTDSEGNPYTMEVETPVYEPKGVKPPIWSLVDRTKTREIEEKVRRAESLPEDVREFLLASAQRHLSFDYEAIAEWYCHASAEEQRLAEESALVIIDFNKAIEGGYVRVCSRLREMAGDLIKERVER